MHLIQRVSVTSGSRLFPHVSNADFNIESSVIYLASSGLVPKKKKKSSMVYNLSQHVPPTRWIHEWDRSALCCARASRSILSHRVNQAAVCAFSSFLSCELFVFLNLWLSLSTRLLILATESLIARAGVQQRRRPHQRLADQDAKLQIYFAERFSCFPEISFTQKKLPDSLHIMWHVLSLLILMIMAPHENTSWWERPPGFWHAPLFR